MSDKNFINIMSDEEFRKLVESVLSQIQIPEILKINQKQEQEQKQKQEYEQKNVYYHNGYCMVEAKKVSDIPNNYYEHGIYFYEKTDNDTYKPCYVRTYGKTFKVEPYNDPLDNTYVCVNSKMILSNKACIKKGEVLYTILDNGEYKESYVVGLDRKIFKIV